MGTLEQLRQAAKNGGSDPVQVTMSDEEEHRLIAERDREDARRAVYAKEELERLANQVTNVAAKRSEIVLNHLASEAQTRYFASLCNRLAHSGVTEFTEIAWTANEWHANLFGKYGGIPKHLVSTAIDRLKAHVARMEAAKPVLSVPSPASAKTVRVDVEDGRYALRGEDGVVRFYHVKHSKSTGKAYVLIQAGPETHLLNWFREGLEVAIKIAEAPHDAQVLYGQELGSCYHCGRDLTDETSRSLGIGPVCRSKG